MSSRVTRPRTRPVSMRTRRQRIAAGAVLATTGLLGTYLAAIRPQPTYASQNGGVQQGQGLDSRAAVRPMAVTLPTCGQADDTVSTEGDLRAAILSSDDTSVICIDGTITLNADLPTLDDTSVTFIGATDDSTAHGIDGQGNYQGINADFTGASDDSLIVHGLSFTNLLSALYGGAINVKSTVGTADYLYVGDSIFEYNVADWGGAIGTYEIARVTLHEIYAKGNDAVGGGGDGGALHIGEDNGVSTDVRIVGSAFVSNSTTDNGGAVNTNDGSVYIVDSSFVSNGATDDGGAVNLNNGSLTIVRSTFERNAADNYDGGGINVGEGSVTITDSDFTENTTGDGGSTDSGAAIHVGDNSLSTSSLAVTDSYFGYNVATGDAGAIYLGADGTTAVITNTTFAGNRGNGSDSGAVRINGGSIAVTLTDDTFINNYAEEEGGALKIDSSAASTITRTLFQGNDVGRAGNSVGGALYLENSGSVAISASRFIGNGDDTAPDNGGAINTDTVDLTITDSVFTSNTAAEEGGAIYSDRPDVYVYTTEFSGNRALNQEGGAVYTDTGELYIYTSTFESNSAPNDDGGAIYSFEGDVYITACTFLTNSADVDGGAIRVDDANLTVTGSTFDSNRSGDDGGAIDAFLILADSSYFNDNYSVAKGGAIWIDTYAQIADSAFVGNDSAGIGGAVYIDGDSSVTTTISSSSFINNGDDTAPNAGGGLYHWNAGPLDVTNSTFIGNKARNAGGAIYLYDSGNTYDDTISFSTISGNTLTNRATNGGAGIFASAINGGGTSTTRIYNSIITNNDGNTGIASDVYDDSTINGLLKNSVITSPASSNITGSDVKTGDPLLASLANNGGPLIGDDSAYYLPTAIPAWNSPAVGAADPALTPSITTTQIGTVRAGNVAGAMNASAAPPPTYPPSAPLNVTGTGGDQSATISWTEPSSSGSFPITDYQVVLAPGGATCLVQAPALSCTIDGLTNGTEYTATARALNGSGWGPYSTASEPFTPENPTPPVTKTIVITGSRTEVRGKPGVQANGTTTGLVGATVQARVHLAGEVDYYDGSKRTVNDDGTFVWSRRTGKKTYVFFTAEDGTIRSNRVVIQAN